MSDQYDKVDEYARGYSAGYTAAMTQYRKPLPSPEVVAMLGKSYAKGFAEGIAQWRKDSEG